MDVLIVLLSITLGYFLVQGQWVAATVTLVLTVAAIKFMFYQKARPCSEFLILTEQHKVWESSGFFDGIINPKVDLYYRWSNHKNECEKCFHSYTQGLVPPGLFCPGGSKK